MLRGFYIFLGVMSLYNGLHMLILPHDWFNHGPPGVTDSGAFNAHFVRDVGVAFTLMAAGSFWCAWKPWNCEVVHYGLTWFFVGHGVLHIFDILQARLPVSHWLLDLPGVFLPAILLVLLCIPPIRKRFLKTSTT